LKIGTKILEVTKILQPIARFPFLNFLAICKSSFQPTIYEIPQRNVVCFSCAFSFFIHCKEKSQTFGQEG
jgi:hypothetical protein